MPRVEALDALRGMFALAVAVYHLTVWTGALEGAARDASVVAGVYSVQGFFIISGFCFFRLYTRAQFDWPALKRFHIRRFMRIAPLFYAALLLSYAVGKPVNPAADWGRWLENMTLSFALFHPNHAMVMGGWSIGIEYLFYAALPLLVWIARSPLALGACAAALIACAVPYTFGKVERAPLPQQFHTYVQVANHAFLFLLGGLVAELHRRSRWRMPGAIALGSIALLAFAVVRTQPTVVDHLEVMIGFVRVKYVLVCLAIVALAAFARNSISPLAAPLRKLGDISYSVYLVHPFAWLLTAAVVRDHVDPPAQLLLGVLATLALAACTERWLERPLLSLGRRWTSMDDTTAR